MEHSTDDSAEEGSRGFQLELAKSYAAFAIRAIRVRKGLVALLTCVGLALTVAVGVWFPRTFTCTTVLMTVVNPVLDAERSGNPLTGSESLIMRHENLEALIRETDLVNKFKERRPPLLKLKDGIIEWAFGKLDHKTMVAVLVGTLESKLFVESKEDNLTITVNWSDKKTVAELAEATKQGFLKMRHAAEISAFSEKMAILDTHATKLRDEIGGLAEQMNAAFDTRAAQVSKATSPVSAPLAPGAPPLVRARTAAVTDEQLPELREKLVTLKQKLAAAEAEHNARVKDERAKLNELKLRYTPSHPQVVTQEERFAMVSQSPSEVAQQRSEATDLAAQIKQRESLLKTAASGGRGQSARAPATGAGDAAVSAEPLPSEIMQLLARDDGDPALTAQISGAVVRYGSLRDEVRAAKLSLDTAQAAYNHRYRVVIPVEEPNKPSKPNVALILAVGVLLSLLLALLSPVLLELRKGVLVEYWQVHNFHLPVLAELHLPSRAEE